MSKFLAPIHSWLFNKIQIHEALEKEIEKNFKSKYGPSIDPIITANIDKFGPRLKSDNLEEIIDQGNIHGWLQDNIIVAETRQAAIIGDLVDQYGDEAIDLIKNIYRDHAIESAKQDIAPDLPEDMYKVINNYVLDGMPCDNAASITKSDETSLEAVQKSCLHIAYWKNAGVDADLMYSLREEWTKAFVHELNPLFEYSVNVDKLDDGSRNFIYTIKAK